jgi:hypothetical protein
MLKQPKPYDPRKVREGLRIQFLETTPVAAPTTLAPLFETNLTETLGIRKFLIMSLEDTRQQIALAARDPQVSRAHFNRMKVNAVVITAWLTSALEMVDQMLGTAASQPEQEIKQ